MPKEELFLLFCCPNLKTGIRGIKTSSPCMELGTYRRPLTRSQDTDKGRSRDCLQYLKELWNLESFVMVSTVMKFYWHFYSLNKYPFNIELLREFIKKKWCVMMMKLLLTSFLLREMKNEVPFFFHRLDCQKLKSSITALLVQVWKNRHFLTCGCINRCNLFGKQSHNICQNDKWYSMSLQL